MIPRATAVLPGFLCPHMYVIEPELSYVCTSKTGLPPLCRPSFGRARELQKHVWLKRPPCSTETELQLKQK